MRHPLGVRPPGRLMRAPQVADFYSAHWPDFTPPLTVMAYKRLEEHEFTWPAVKDGLMTLSHAQFEALFSGLDWRRVRAVEARAPEAVE